MRYIITLLCIFCCLSIHAQDIFQGLVAYYPFTENANDESTFNHHGQVNGASLTEDRFGTPNSAYNFNGIDNFIRVEHSEEFNFGTNDPYSVSIWFLASETQEELTVPGNDILSKWFIDGNETQTAGYTLVLRYSNQIADNPFVMRAFRFDGYPNNCVNVQVIGTEIVKEIWHHVVFTFDESGIFKFYYDNVLIDSQANNLVCSPQNTSPLLIGKRGAAPHPNHFTGKIDDLRIYQRAISEDEIQILFEENPTPISSITKTKLLDFTIYPNPAQSLIALDIPLSTDVQKIQIRDLTGKVITVQDWEIGQKIELGNLASGVYFILLEDNNGQIIGREKFIKLGGIRA